MEAGVAAARWRVGAERERRPLAVESAESSILPGTPLSALRPSAERQHGIPSRLLGIRWAI